MKNITKIFAIALVALGFSTSAIAQATVSTSAGAKIIGPISLTQTSPLHFGTMSVLAATPGTCVLSTQGVRSATAGVNLSGQAPTFTNAAYNVGGAASTSYAITLPTSITVTEAATSTTMLINGLLARTTSAGTDGLTGTLSVGGLDAFTIGGTLNVNAGQAAQVYTGSFNVIVAYN